MSFIRHCERSEAIRLAAQREELLLRFVRNDVDRPRRRGYGRGVLDNPAFAGHDGLLQFLCRHCLRQTQAFAQGSEATTCRP